MKKKHALLIGIVGIFLLCFINQNHASALDLHPTNTGTPTWIVPTSPPYDAPEITLTPTCTFTSTPYPTPGYPAPSTPVPYPAPDQEETLIGYPAPGTGGEFVVSNIQGGPPPEKNIPLELNPITQRNLPINQKGILARITETIFHLFRNLKINK